MPLFFFLAASIAGASHNSQDVEENVDDVGVEVEGGKDVLLWAQRELLVAQEKLSVDGQKLQRGKPHKDGVQMSFYNEATIASVFSQCATLPVALDYIHIWLKQRIDNGSLCVKLTQVKSSAPREA